MTNASARAWGASAELLPQPKPHTRPFQARLNGALRLRCSINFGFWVPRIWHRCRQFELLTSGLHGALAGPTNYISTTELSRCNASLSSYNLPDSVQTSEFDGLEVGQLGFACRYPCRPLHCCAASSCVAPSGPLEAHLSHSTS